MKQLSKMELLNLLGGSVQAHSRCDDLVINANKNGATWSDGEWDLWADQFKSIAKTLLNRWRKDPLQPFNYL